MKYLWENLFRKNQKEQDILSLLKDNFIFGDLNFKELQLVRKSVHTRHFKAGELIFKQGELGIGMYIVSKGTVNISIEDFAAQNEEGQRRFITRLKKGDFFGEIALVEKNGYRTATAMARDDVTLIGFFKPDLSEIIDRSPNTGIKIVSRLAEVLGKRLKETAEKFSQLKREIKERNKH